MHPIGAATRSTAAAATPAEAPSTFPLVSSGQVGQHDLKRLFGVFDTLLSAPTDQTVRAHQHRTTRAYTIGRWPTSINIHEVAADADTPCDQPNAQPISHQQSGIAPRRAVRTCQQHEVLTEQI